MSKAVAAKVDSKSLAEPVAESPDVYVESGSEGSLTPRQRTKVEKRDQAVAELDEESKHCDNHPDREAFESSDGGGTHSMQHLCKECVARISG